MKLCQDLALPFIASGRFETDTLFLVFENDFRFRPDDYPEPPPRPADELRAADLAPPEQVAPLGPGRTVRVVRNKYTSFIIYHISWNNAGPDSKQV